MNILFLSEVSYCLSIIAKSLKMLNFSLNMIRVTHWWCWVFNEFYIFLTYFWITIKLCCLYEFEINMTLVLEINMFSWFPPKLTPLHLRLLSSLDQASWFNVWRILVSLKYSWRDIWDKDWRLSNLIVCN